MKKSLIIIFLLVLISAANLTISQDTNIAKYLPLKVGNTWIYYFQGYYQFYGFQSGYNKYKITGTQNVNGKIFYSFQSVTVMVTGTLGCDCSELSQFYGTRLDSTTGVISINNNCAGNVLLLYDSLKAKLRDTSHTCRSSYPFDRIACVDTNITGIFNNSYSTKYFVYQAQEGGEARRYAKALGIIYYDRGIMQGTCHSDLKGCVINGVVYGDTSMIVGIIPVSTETPKSLIFTKTIPIRSIRLQK